MAGSTVLLSPLAFSQMTRETVAPSVADSMPVNDVRYFATITGIGTDGWSTLRVERGRRFEKPDTVRERLCRCARRFRAPTWGSAPDGARRTPRAFSIPRLFFAALSSPSIAPAAQPRDSCGLQNTPQGSDQFFKVTSMPVPNMGAGKLRSQNTSLHFGPFDPPGQYQP